MRFLKSVGFMGVLALGGCNSPEEHIESSIDKSHFSSMLEKAKGVESDNLNYMRAYNYFTSNGVEPRHVKRISLEHINDIEGSFKSGRLPAHFLKLFSDDFIGYSRKAAQSDPDFEKGGDWAKSYLSNALKNRRHVCRAGADYSEDASQVEKIKDTHIVYLIKRYLDFFDRESASIIPSLFPINSKYEERGGLVFSSHYGLKFIPLVQYVDDVEKRELAHNPEYAYRMPLIDFYIPTIGMLHTHPKKEEECENTYAGPSGQAHSLKAYPRGGDIYCLEQMTKTNPLTIDAVISELNLGMYNVDILFRDISQDASINPVTVIDLGVYDYFGNVVKN